MIIGRRRDDESWSHWLSRTTGFFAQFVFGRRRTASWGESLARAAALDPEDHMGDNGELLVQEVALAEGSEAEPLVVLDVGAHRGAWAEPLLERAKWLGMGHVRVHCLEPASADLAALRAALAEYVDAGVLHARHLGAGSEARRAVLHPHEESGCASLYGARAPDAPPEEVDLVRLDEYCEAEGLSHLRLLKVDTEGHDMEVLRGAEALLDRAAVDLLQFEYEPRWIHARAFLKDAFDYLQPRGYLVGKLTARGVEVYRRWSPGLETFRQGNWLAVHEEHLPDLAGFSWWGAA